MSRFIAAIVFGAALLATSLANAQTRRSLTRADGAITPVIDYLPFQSDCPPTMILSHGFGGDEKSLDGLAKGMAERGWRIVAMGHRESGRAELRAAFLSGGLPSVESAARGFEKHLKRFWDLDAAINDATQLCRPFPLVLAGHSMGAQTTMMEAGAVPKIGKMGSDRFDAYVALSPQGVGTTFNSSAWNNVSKPVLLITGTNDRVVEGDYTRRLTAFEGLPAGRKRLAIINAAGHLQIGGIGSPRITDMIVRLVADFTGQISGRSWRPAEPVDGVRVLEK